MKIKIIMKKPLSYFFHGPVSLNNFNTIENPFVIDLETLTKQDLIGINRAHNTEVIQVIEGLEEFKAKIATYAKTKKEAILVDEVKVDVPEVVVEEVKEETKVEDSKVEDEPVVELKDEPEIVEEIKEDEPKVEVSEETPKPTPTTRKRAVVKK